MIDYQAVIDKYYPAGDPARDIYMRHAESVAGEALAIVRNRHLPLDEATVMAAAMLHDAVPTRREYTATDQNPIWHTE